MLRQTGTNSNGDRGMSWYDSACVYIQKAHETVPENATLKERMKIIDAAYPWGQRRMYPYKMWLKARKKYMAKYEQKPMSWG
jgi:hypothetical protein